MTRRREEAIAAGIKVEETKHNMKRRKPWHNYQRKGTYMITLVVEGRHPLFGRQIMPTEENNTATAHIELTDLGKAILNEEVKKIPAFYNMVEVWKLCIMPDHIHIIVRVTGDMPEGKHLGHVVRGFKVGCTRAWWRLTSKDRPAGDAAGVMKTRKAAGVMNAGDTAGVMKAGEAAGVMNAGDAAGVMNAGDAAGVMNAGDAAGVMNAGDAAGVWRPRPPFPQFLLRPRAARCSSRAAIMTRYCWKTGSSATGSVTWMTTHGA
jgi:REP element-mobilizing transposase RayT